MLNTKQLFKWLHTKYQWNDVVPLNLQLNHPKLIIVTGENASGKSLVRRIIHQLAKRNNVDAVAVSPEFKQNGGIATAFVFGDESYQASGVIAVNVCLGSITTSKKRTIPHCVILDEPDMGLSDNAAAGVGQEICDFIQNPPKLLQFYAIITHRKELIKPMLALNPSHIRLRDELNLFQVVNQPVVPLNLNELKKNAHNLFLELTKRLKE